MKVRRYTSSDAAPIERLNQRLRAAGVAEVVYPEGAEQTRPGDVRERLFVAEDDGEIRGGVWLREQTFRVRGADVACGWLKYPVAESLIDTRFSGVPGSLLIQCLREQPRLFALGLGGHETPLSRMLRALRWSGVSVPMLVKAVHPSRCLRRLPALRRTATRRMAADALAFTGLGWLGASGLAVTGAVRSRRGAMRAAYQAEPCERLGSWADSVWARTRDTYDVIASRDATTVEGLLPASPDIARLRVRHRGEDAGWVCVLRHDFGQGVPDRNFDTLTVGLIADALAAPGHAAGVLRAADDFLTRSGVDLVFSNQLHPMWSAPLRRMGYLSGPSNFAFYASPAGAALVADMSSVYLTRGDCDGPMWYGAR